ncbi:MAG: 1-acyl-sn-glycerol-3-phosphate acyltransferase [Prolixibacteraceae bacterium]
MSYDDIRPYQDHEVNQYIRVLLNDEVFRQVLTYIFKEENKVNEICKLLSGINSINELQMKFMYPLIKEWIIEKTTSGVTSSGLENLDKTQSYLFFSNHRDIILDSAILNFIIANAGMNTTEVAVGNNLLIYDWIEHALKLNRCFIVQRNLPARELLTASKQLSRYIRESISRNNDSVWIAQREGRTKDGNDQTQTALLKMLNLSNEGSLVEGFRQLKIVPLSISYEREPCGISKVEEIYKREHESYIKKPADDFKSMAYGLLKPKGRVHFAFGSPIDKQLDELINPDNLNESIQRLGEYIDACIYKNYKLWPNNYLAADLLAGSNDHQALVDDGIRDKFSELLEDLVKTIGGGDPGCQKRLFLQMYANPLLNAERTSKSKLIL